MTECMPTKLNTTKSMTAGVDEPEKTVLKLSDLFPERLRGMEADVSVNTTMLNINYGHNRELLENLHSRDTTLGCHYENRRKC